MEFPTKLREVLVALRDDDDIYDISAESHMWGSTAMGLGGIGGAAMTGGWIVTLERRDATEVWHVSDWGAKLASSMPRG